MPRNPQSGSKPPDGQAFGDIQSRLTGEPVLVTQSERCSEWDVRFGWWGMSAHRFPGQGRRVPGPELLAVL